MTERLRRVASTKLPAKRPVGRPPAELIDGLTPRLAKAMEKLRTRDAKALAGGRVLPKDTHEALPQVFSPPLVRRQRERGGGCAFRRRARVARQRLRRLQLRHGRSLPIPRGRVRKARKSCPIPTVSLILLRTSTIEQPPPSTDEQATAERVFVRVYGLPGVPTGAVIDVGTTLKQGGLPLIVDGLKKAVMKKLANSLVDTGIIAHLMVYPAGPERGTEPYTAMSTQLAAAPEESPYHVELPDKSAVKAAAVTRRPS